MKKRRGITPRTSRFPLGGKMFFSTDAHRKGDHAHPTTNLLLIEEDGAGARDPRKGVNSPIWRAEGADQ